MRKKYFDQDLYKKIRNNDLIIFCIYSVLEKREKCSFERLIKECFNLFPKAFSFSTISKWPDSRKLDRPLRTLRKKKIVKGGPQDSYSLTNLGKKSAKETAKVFGQIKLKL